MTHTDNKRHMCPVCGKKYADTRCFQKHVASHSSSLTSPSSSPATAASYECSQCNVHFNDLRSLRVHTSTHLIEKTMEPNNQCYFCGNCGQQLTIQLNTSAEIVLTANCGCSGDVGVDSGLQQNDVVNVIAVNSSDVLTTSEEACVKLEILNEEDDLQLLHRHLSS